MTRHLLPLALVAAFAGSGCTITLPAPQAPRPGTQPVTVSSGPASKNPIIQSFTANPTNITKGQPITFQVVAHDPNGESLQYNWSATGGILSATTGQAIIWSPPQEPGLYTVMVTVTNGRGGIVTGSHNLTVLANGAAIATRVPPSSTPSPLPSVVAATPTPPASPSPTPSPSPSPKTSPTPTPTPTPPPVSGCAADGSLPTIDLSRHDCYLDIPDSQRVINPLKDSYKIGVHSASDTRYWISVSMVTMNGSAGEGGGTDYPGMTSASTYKGTFVVTFAPSRPDELYFDMLESKRVRLNDCAIADFQFLNNAIPITRANWKGSFPAPTRPGEPDYAKCAYVFTYDGQFVDLGTFELP